MTRRLDSRDMSDPGWDSDLADAIDRLFAGAGLEIRLTQRGSLWRGECINRDTGLPVDLPPTLSLEEDPDEARFEIYARVLEQLGDQVLAVEAQGSAALH